MHDAIIGGRDVWSRDCVPVVDSHIRAFLNGQSKHRQLSEAEVWMFGAATAVQEILLFMLSNSPT